MQVALTRLYGNKVKVIPLKGNKAKLVKSFKCAIVCSFDDDSFLKPNQELTYFQARLIPICFLSHN